MLTISMNCTEPRYFTRLLVVDCFSAVSVHRCIVLSQVYLLSITISIIGYCLELLCPY